MNAAGVAQVCLAIFTDARRTGGLPVEELQELAGDMSTADVDEIVMSLANHRLITIGIQRDRIWPTGLGMFSWERKCVAEILLGQHYIQSRYSNAVVHVIVEDELCKESGAAGFFCFDYPDFVVTARHVVQGHRVVRIMHSNDTALADAPFEVVTGPATIDLALIKCVMPEAINPLRIEWDASQIGRLDNVLVFGYPLVPNHLPRLFCARGEINSLVPDFQNQSKLLLSSPARPGCSGGPVVNESGLVVGVMEQTNVGVLEDGVHSYLTATLAASVREVLLPLRE